MGIFFSNRAPLPSSAFEGLGEVGDEEEGGTEEGSGREVKEGEEEGRTERTMTPISCDISITPPPRKKN